jgi:hypothetical protein
MVTHAGPVKAHTEVMRPSQEPRSFIPYEIPLRPGVTARLVLPGNLTAAEAERLCEVIRSVAFSDAEIRRAG